jgi:cytoskeletal protein CcmA (bactofilin family)
MFNKEKEEKKKGGDVIGLIGKGMTVQGKLSFEDTVRIDGNFNGEINSGGTLVIGESAHVEGEIKVGSAIITGEVCGIIEAKTRVELQSPAKITGEIRTPNLIIGDGAVFDGKCVMLKNDPSANVETAGFGSAADVNYKQSANF